MFSECIEQRGVRQLAAMPESQLPAHNLPGLEVEYHCEIVPAALEPQVRKVLYPATRIDHARVAHAVLRSALISVVRKTFQCIGCRYYLSGYATAVAFLLARTRYANTCKRPNTPSFVVTPAEVKAQTPDAVQRMLFMSRQQNLDCLFISGLQHERLLVVATAGDTQSGYEVLLPSWVDFLQNG